MAITVQLKFLLILLVFINTQQVHSQSINIQSVLNLAKGILCVQDSDCPAGNCTLFVCKPVGCRSDADCLKWGYGSNFFCKNQKLPILGTECIAKYGTGHVCVFKNQCQSGNCNFFKCQ